MITRFLGYHYGYRIVSLAKTISTKDDLLVDNLSFLYLNCDSVILYPDEVVLTCESETLDYLRSSLDYDVFELWPNGRLSCCFSNASTENYFFLTSKCNSNCIMCPSPSAVRRKGVSAETDDLIELAKHIPTNVEHLTITGGEPFLLGRDVFRFISFLRDKFEMTEFLFLTNGRIFAVQEFAALFASAAPTNCIVAIPIHAANPIRHDSISRSPGSFYQTVVGIKNLLRLGMKIEIRLVMSKLNIDEFPAIVEFITHEIPEIIYVSVIAMEMTGSARDNQKELWLPYSQIFSAISDGILRLLKQSIDVRLYNFPLCTVDKGFWPICEKSISPSKIRYSEVCDCCHQKDACGGVFAGTFLLEKDDLKAIV